MTPPKESDPKESDPKSANRPLTLVASRIVLRDPPSNSAGAPVVKPLPGLKRAGRYRVIGEIARGGIGVVLKGHDEDLGRDVAMKVLRDEHAKNVNVVQRFLEEAQIGGQLQHPGIVPVYEFGTGDGDTPFFTMKLVKGRTLSALLHDRKDLASERRRFCAIFEAVCHTVAYAHSRGVIHRDLKPANIMVGAFGEVQVVDWGLAKVLGTGGIADERRAHDSTTSVIMTVRSGDVGSQSLAGSIFGTPAYMPPEQARGFVDMLDERSDVFSLGAILCEILTGKPPYVGTGMEILEKAARGDLEHARHWLAECGADPGLVQIANDCLEPAHSKRPVSAEEVAPRVATWLASADERARVAEVDAANSRARIRGLLLAICGLGVVFFAAGSWWWTEKKARQRVETATQSVRSELDNVVALLATARAAPLGETEPWERASDAARSAETLARNVEADPDVRARTVSLRSDIERDALAARADADRQSRDRAMVERLQEIRGTEQDPGSTTREDFAAAFAGYGIDVLALPVAESVAKVEGSRIRDELAMGLDYWAAIDAENAVRLREIVRAADPDPWRTRLRSTKNPEDLRALAEAADVETFPIEGFVELIYALAAGNVFDTAIDVAEKVVLVHPDDFSIRMVLADVLSRQQPPRIDDALRHVTAAIALRPRSWTAWRRSGILFSEAERLPDALACFRRVAAIRPEDAHSHLFLAYTLSAARKHAETAEACDRALTLRPGWASALLVLGMAHSNLGRHKEAVETLRLAVRRFTGQTAPSGSGDYVKASAWLSFALLRAGDLEQASVEAERAIALDPGRRSALAHDVRGVLRFRQGDLEGARSALEESIRVNPDEPQPFCDLGQLELADGRYEEAAKAMRECLLIDPDCVAAHTGLGTALEACGDLDGAVDEFAAAAKLDARDVAIFGKLGLAQRAKGRWREALDAFRRQLQLAAGASASDTSQATQSAKEWIADTERLAALEPRLLGLLKNSATAASAREALDLARLCAIRRLPHAATGFYERAFALEPGLAEDLDSGNRFAAARAAAQAACGRGGDAEGLDDSARATAGTQALAWLRDDLVLRHEMIATGSDEEVREAKAALERWRIDPDLAGVREEADLAKLSPAERAEWSALWTEVRELVARE